MPIKRFGADSVVNKTAVGGQIVPQVTGLADGEYVVTEVRCGNRLSG